MPDLLLPIHVHSLVVGPHEPIRVAGAPLDYASLPWFDGKRDHNSTVPNLASAITAEPFSDHQFWLNPGVHLHWTLPDGLKRGANRRDPVRSVPVHELWFPPAPNRWLVRRSHVSGASSSTRAWLVESDHVHAGSRKPVEPAIAYPRKQAGDHPPWLWLGRTIPLDPNTLTPFDQSVQPGNPALMVSATGAPLTALGPGDPTFAAHYPSCHSVFGLHDQESLPDQSTVRYTVYGWYSKEIDDPLSVALESAFENPDQLLSYLRAVADQEGQDPPIELDDRPLSPAEQLDVTRQVLRKTFGWELDANAREVPTDFIAQGQAQVRHEPARHDPPPTRSVIGLGSSAAEALVALKTDEPTRQLEDLLVQSLAASDLKAHPLDLSQKLKEQRHNEQFTGEPGHGIWILRGNEDKAQNDTDKVPPPSAVAHELAVLNELQRGFDANRTMIEGLRQDLFCDWSHAMIAMYPEGDDQSFGDNIGSLTDLIDYTRLRPLESLIEQTGRLYFGLSHGGIMMVSDQANPESEQVAKENTLAAGVVQQHRKVLAALRSSADTVADFTLSLTPGPRFWRANDPVIVLDEAHARPRQRHGHDGQHIALHADSTSALSIAQVHADRAGGWDNSGKAFAGNARAPVDILDSDLHHVTQDPPVSWLVHYDADGWDPLTLEWEVELRPLEPDSAANATNYDPDFLLRGHRLPVASAEFERFGASRRVSETYQYIAGRAILNPSVGRLLERRIEVLPDKLKNEFKSLKGTPTILPLGGFHDLLLMKTQDRQIDVADPIGLPGQKALAARVRAALGKFHPAAPHLSAAFHPVRSGELHIHRLRVMDVFGRKHDSQPEALRTAARMRSPGQNKAVLPLRLSQAARINFRWLAAGGDDVEVNAHPKTSPIFGWILANELDGTIEIYSREGQLLGAIDASGVWQRAPGDSTAPRSWHDIENSNLATTVRWLIESGRDFAGTFIEMLDLALERIDPAAAARLRPRAALLGRPLALVRAKLGLELAHHMAINQSRAAVRARVSGIAGDTNAVESVRVPVRLGEYGQLNDGLCGYWIETKDGFAGSAFHAVHSGGPGTGSRDTTPVGTAKSVTRRFNKVTNKDEAIARLMWVMQAPIEKLTHTIAAARPRERIAYVDENDLTKFPVTLTPNGPPLTVTLLMEPHGSVHATSGILPTKSIAIPPEHYHEQLSRLRVTFRTGPVLTPRDAIELPLPEEPGFSWSWLDRNGKHGGWREVPHHPTINRADFLDRFGPVAQQLWRILQLEGRLVPQNGGETAVVMPGEPGDAPDRYGKLDPATVQRGLLELADAIEPVQRRATWRPRPIALDGWLQLQPDPEPARPNAAKSPVTTSVNWGETS